jgi:hypothetical protein
MHKKDNIHAIIENAKKHCREIYVPTQYYHNYCLLRGARQSKIHTMLWKWGKTIYITLTLFL